jgi:Peptidase family M28
MKLKLIVLSAIIFVGCKSAASISNTQEKTNDNIKSSGVETFMNTISETNISKNLYIIAADSMEGRNTGEIGQKKAGKYLIEQYKKIGLSFPTGASSFYQKVPAEFMKRGFTSAKLNDSENIWAFIEGSEKPEEIVVISAHYDHVGVKNGEVYNGADDDGSGTVAVLEIAKAFAEAKKAGKGPKRSILFLHVTGEELGLHGSRYYSEYPLFPLKNTVVDINIDMIGRRDKLNNHDKDGNYIYVIGSDRLSSELHSINEQVNKDYVNLNLDYKYNDRNDPERIYFRSDHYNFARKGIPSIFFFNGVHDDYHKETDTADKIEYDLLTKRAKLAFGLAWEIANRDKRIVVDKDGK